MAIPPHVRILARSIPNEHGCLMFQGYKRRGYGIVSENIDGNARTLRVHVVVYTSLVGPVAEGLVLDHICHNADPTCLGGPTCPHRACVNTDHLEPVTPGENTRRARQQAITAGRPGLVRSDPNFCMKGHELTPANTYTDPSGYNHCRTCREKSGKERRAREALTRPSLCRNGHERTSENTYIGSDGYRHCRVCRAAIKKKYREAKRHTT